MIVEKDIVCVYYLSKTTANSNIFIYATVEKIMSMDLMLNVVSTSGDGVVVMRCREFPNIIVEGKDDKEATENFKKAFAYFLNARNEIEDTYPLAKNEITRPLKMEFLANE